MSDHSLRLTMFCYGILRPAAHGWQRGLRPLVTDCTVPGQLFWCDDQPGSYPLAKLDRPGSIVGDVVEFPDLEAWRRVCDMEQGAGYMLVPVRTYSRVPGMTHMVLRDTVAWHYMYDNVGQRLSSGDWIEEMDRLQV